MWATTGPSELFSKLPRRIADWASDNTVSVYFLSGRRIRCPRFLPFQYKSCVYLSDVRTRISFINCTMILQFGGSPRKLYMNKTLYVTPNASCYGLWENADVVWVAIWSKQWSVGHIQHMWGKHVGFCQKRAHITSGSTCRTCISRDILSHNLFSLRVKRAYQVVVN